MQTTKINQKLHHTPIAIIGMASLFPKARNLREYWENIGEQRDEREVLKLEAYIGCFRMRCPWQPSEMVSQPQYLGLLII